jgi:hypothetical protein
MSSVVLLFLLFDLLEVEVQLLALKDVPVTTARLSWARSDASIKLTTEELVSQVLIQSVSLAIGSVLTENAKRKRTLSKVN